MDNITELRSPTTNDRLGVVWQSVIGEARGMDNYYGLCSPTLRPRYALHELLDGSIAGKSFLDVGCFDGGYCFQALEAGAAAVVGIDSDPLAIHDARERAKRFDGRAQFFTWQDVSGDVLETRFDIVVCMSEVERTISPLGLLNGLAKLAGDRLVVGCSPWNGRAIQRRLGTRAPRWLLSQLKRFPLGIFLTKIMRRQGQVVLSPAAIRNFLLYQMYRFKEAKIVEDRSTSRRTLVVATRRRIKNLIVLAGPDGAGKSTLASAIKANQAAAILKQMDIEPLLSWHLTHQQKLPHLASHVDNVILHYNMLNTLKSYTRTFDLDPTLTLLENAENLYIITIWANSETLRERTRKRLVGLSGTKRTEPGTRVLQFYENRALVRNLYERWFEFCEHQAKPAGHWVMESDDRQCLTRVDKWCFTQKE